MKQRKIISLLIAFLMVFSIVTASALAADTPLTVSYLTVAPGSDATQLTFSWHTAAKAALPSVRIWAADAAPAEFTGTVSSATSTISAMYYNGVTVTGLASDTAYTYQVGDGSGSWSAEYTVKTKNPASFSYIVVGDPQIGSSNVANDTTAWVNTMKLLEENFPNAAFLSGTGDQIETSGTKSHYDGFFSPAQMKTLPFASCMGNHEGSGAATRTFYNPPNADSVQNYWYRYGDTLFLVWNCTTGSASTMRTFLTAAIAANPDATWKILNFHYDVYGQGNSHATSDGKTYRDTYVQVIDEFGIDVVFNGHDHSYNRAYPMKWSGSSGTSSTAGRQPETFNESGASVDPTGTVYFSLNSSTGSKYYALIAQQYYTAAMHQANRPEFSVVDMTASAFTCTTYMINTDGTFTQIDAYTIQKTVETPEPEPEPEPVALVLNSNKNIVKPDEYFNVSVSFSEKVASNVAKLDLAFDADKFEFAGYTPADGATLISRAYGAGYVSLIVMLPSYDMQSLGSVMLKAGASVGMTSSAINAAATFVERGGVEKTIKTSDGAYTQKTNNAGTPGFAVDLITLSNLIDVFGLTSTDAGWDNYSYFDFNGNYEIDIFDITTLAQMIK